MKIRHTLNIAAAVGILCGTVYAQPPMGKPREGGGHPEHASRGKAGTQHGEEFMEAIVGNRAAAKELGLSDEQVQEMRDQIHAGRIRMIDLRADLEKAAVEQARLLMQTPVNESELMSLVEKTGAIRTEMAKERIKHVVLLKNTLTPEQAEKARRLMSRHRERSREDTERERVSEEVRRHGSDESGNRRRSVEGERQERGDVDREEMRKRFKEKVSERRRAQDPENRRKDEGEEEDASPSDN